MAKKDQIVEEVRNKKEDYETNMSGFIADFNLWADLFTMKPPKKRQSNSFSNPRTAEMFRAVNALATLEMRMMTAQDPYFDLAPMDINLDNRRLSVIQSTLETQLQASEYKRYLLKALVSKILFGTVFVEEPFENINLNNQGRIMPTTLFKPRSLLQVAFDRNCSDLDASDWITTADVITKQRLLSLKLNDPGNIWIDSELNAALSDNAPITNQNSYVMSRLSSAGYSTEDQQKDIRELTIYRGKLDTLNDGIEYIVGVINGKYLVRFDPNNFQHGRRNIRIARWVEFELEPLAYGLGKLLAPLHKSLDANRQKVQDAITFDTYSMWIMDRLAGINAQDLKIKPMQLIESDNINGMKRLDSNVAGATLGAKLEDILKAEFQSASGATPTLQALVTEATASEVSLAQNEALRNISVKAEIAAESLVRQHLEIMHSNNMTNIDEPFNVSVGGQVRRVYPADLWYDVDFKIKVTTDKDFKPQRLKSMGEALQMLTSIRNDHPELADVSILPLIMEIFRSLGVNIEAPRRRPLSVGPSVPLPNQTGPIPPVSLSAPAPSSVAAVVDTPVGPTLASP